MQKYNGLNRLQNTDYITEHQTASANGNWIGNKIRVEVWVLMTTTIMGGGVMTEQAFASAKTHQYHIAAQSLNNALIRFAADSALELLLNADMVRGLKARALEGELTPEQALTQLLQDSGLNYRFVNERTVTLTPKLEIQGAGEKIKPSLPEKSAVARPNPIPKQPPLTLQTMTVTAVVDENSTSYQVRNSLSATKTDTPIKEIPQSVQVVSGPLMADQQNITVSESLQNVSGVITRNILYAPVIEGTIIRGFASEQLLDGFTQYYNPGDRESTVNINRVEVLKGSNAVLYSGGSGSPVGGVVNVVSKLPHHKASGEIGMRIGSYDFYQPYADFNQPLTNNLLFRLNGEFTDSGSHVDVVETRRYNINPTLMLTDNDRTTLTLQGKVSRWQQPDYQGLPATGTVAGKFRVDRKSFIGPTDMPNSFSNTDAVWGTLDHSLNGVWSFNVKARYSESEFDQKVQSLFGADGFQADQPAISPSTWALVNAELFQHQHELSFMGNAVAKFNVGHTKNTVLFGADHSELNDKGFIDGDLGPAGFGIGSVNLGSPIFPFGYSKPGLGINNQLINNKTYGGYVQLQSTVYERFHLLSSLRLGNVSLDFKNTVSGVNEQTDELKLLPRIGGVFDLTDEISLFAAYSEGMRGQPFLNFVGAPRAALSKHLETGLKFDIAQQLSGQLAIYQIDRSNVGVTDTSDAQLRSIAAGQQRSQGLELDMLWQPIDAVSILGNYAHTQAKFTDSRAGVPDGNSLGQVPENSGRVWANYRFQQTELKGVSMGAGVYLQSGAFLANNNHFKSDGYHSFDAAITYETRRFKLATTVKNLTDSEFFQAYDYFDGRVAPAAGPSVYVSGSIRY